jgi:hypothetical protein
MCCAAIVCQLSFPVLGRPLRYAMCCYNNSWHFKGQCRVLRCAVGCGPQMTVMQPLLEQTEEDGPCSITLRFSKSVRVSGFRAAHACMPSDSVVFSLPDAERQALDYSYSAFMGVGYSVCHIAMCCQPASLDSHVCASCILIPTCTCLAIVDHSQPVYVLGSSIPADDLGAVVRSAHNKLLTMEFGCV